MGTKICPKCRKELHESFEECPFCHTTLKNVEAADVLRKINDKEKQEVLYKYGISGNISEEEYNKLLDKEQENKKQQVVSGIYDKVSKIHYKVSKIHFWVKLWSILSIIVAVIYLLVSIFSY